MYPSIVTVCFVCMYVCLYVYIYIHTCKQRYIRIFVCRLEFRSYWSKFWSMVYRAIVCSFDRGCGRERIALLCVFPWCSQLSCSLIESYVSVNKGCSVIIGNSVYIDNVALINQVLACKLSFKWHSDCRQKCKNQKYKNV